MHADTLLLLAGVLGRLHWGTSSCYFPVEVQGEFMTQSLAHQEISYTSLAILYNSIPGWGVCHSRHGDRFLLSDTTVNGDLCYKCIKLFPRSRNVLQIYSRDLYQCYTTSSLALTSCPTTTEVTQRKVGEVMLYKTRGFAGESAVSDVPCPITGRWRFTYSMRGSGSSPSSSSSSCSSSSSRATDCPSGLSLVIQFQGCKDKDRKMHYKCLGNWQGTDGQHYMAVMDTELPQLGEELRPRYRCGIYKSDLSRGYTWLALSNDSTCSHQLDSHSAGYETFQLHSLHQTQRRDTGDTYSLPAWAQGHWNDGVSVHRGHVTYSREDDFTTYSLQSVSSPLPSHFLVRVETSCSAATYACLALELRRDNIMELRMGKRGKNPDSQLCQPDAFEDSEWETLGRNVAGMSCPLQGEYSGALPDAEGLCARSITACDKPHLMRYQVYNCDNTTETYEDRSYLCYGVFRESGLVYTVVSRLDLPHRECFVGVTREEGRQSVILEAGRNCGRGKDPDTNGMLLTKTGDQCVAWDWEDKEQENNKDEEVDEDEEEREEEEKEEEEEEERTTVTSVKDSSVRRRQLERIVMDPVIRRNGGGGEEEGGGGRGELGGGGRVIGGSEGEGNIEEEMKRRGEGEKEEPRRGVPREAAGSRTSSSSSSSSSLLLFCLSVILSTAHTRSHHL